MKRSASNRLGWIGQRGGRALETFQLRSHDFTIVHEGGANDGDD
jgi:hypothetical protein